MSNSSNSSNNPKHHRHQTPINLDDD
jgi:hypothetical protein